MERGSLFSRDLMFERDKYDTCNTDNTFSSNYEANDSEIQENVEDIFFAVLLMLSQQSLVCKGLIELFYEPVCKGLIKLFYDDVLTTF